MNDARHADGASAVDVGGQVADEDGLLWRCVEQNTVAKMLLRFSQLESGNA